MLSKSPTKGVNIRSLCLPMATYGSSVIKNLPASTEDWGSVPALGRFAGGGHGNPFQYSCLENPHGQRSLMGCSPCGRRVDTTEQLSTAQHRGVSTGLAGGMA